MNRGTFVRSALAAGGLTPARSPSSAKETRMQVADSIEMCVCDTFGTVVDWHGSVSAEVAELARQKGWSVDGVAFAEAWRGNYGPSMNRVRLMVAAHPTDLDAAKPNGLRTAYVHRPLERGASREPPPWPEAGRFDMLATDLDDLASQLGV